MSVWLIQPRDPLIFRDGKPFNATPGAQAKSLSFPYPSTLAGSVRTRAGMDEAGRFNEQQIDRLLQLNIRGPILAALNKTGEFEDWYFPAPADCLVLQDGEESQGRRLWVHPVELAAGAAANLAQGRLVSANPVVKQKPHTKMPHFWNWHAVQEWLKQPADDATPVELSNIGIAGLTPESRVHVNIDAQIHYRTLL